MKLRAVIIPIYCDSNTEGALISDKLASTTKLGLGPVLNDGVHIFKQALEPVERFVIYLVFKVVSVFFVGETQVHGVGRYPR